MGARVLHLVTSTEATHAQSGVYPRAKALPRGVTCSADRIARAALLDEVMRDLGVKNTQLALWCDVDEKEVRCWRLGSREFGDERVASMRKVGEEFRRRMRGAA